MWYDDRRAGLGVEFVEAFDAALEQIRQWPEIGHLIPRVPADVPARRLPLSRFPYTSPTSSGMGISVCWPSRTTIANPVQPRAHKRQRRVGCIWVLCRLSRLASAHHIQDCFRMFGCYAKQDSRRAFRTSSTLFPVAKCGDADPHEFRELVLRQAIGSPNLLRVGLGRSEHTAGGPFAAKNRATLPDTLEQFVENVSLHFSSLSATRRSCFNWSALRLSRSCLRNTKSINNC